MTNTHLSEADKKALEYENPFSYSFAYNISCQISNLADQAYLQAVQKYANDNNINEVIILGEDELKEVLLLGLSAFKERYGESKQMAMIFRTENEVEIYDHRKNTLR